MHQARKLKLVQAARETEPVAGRFLEGLVVGLGDKGRATFRDEAGAECEARIPRQVDRRWTEITRKSSMKSFSTGTKMLAMKMTSAIGHMPHWIK